MSSSCPGCAAAGSSAGGVTCRSDTSPSLESSRSASMLPDLLGSWALRLRLGGGLRSYVRGGHVVLLVPVIILHEVRAVGVHGEYFAGVPGLATIIPCFHASADGERRRRPGLGSGLRSAGSAGFSRSRPGRSSSRSARMSSAGSSAAGARLSHVRGRNIVLLVPIVKTDVVGLVRVRREDLAGIVGSQPLKRASTRAPIANVSVAGELPASEQAWRARLELLDVREVVCCRRRLWLEGLEFFDIRQVARRRGRRRRLRERRRLLGR